MVIVFLLGCRPVGGDSPGPNPGSASETGDSTGASDSADTAADDTSTGEDSGVDSGSDSGTVETGETDSAEPTVECDRTQSWIYVAAGMQQTCGIHQDGCAECWGLGEDQAGDGGPDGGYRYYHEDRPPPGSYTSLGMYGAPEAWDGPLHMCGVSTEDGLHCWGSNAEDECDIVESTSLVYAVGEDVTFGIDEFGQVWGVGYLIGLPPATAYVGIAVGEAAGYVWDAEGVTSQWPIHNSDPAWVEVLDDAYVQVDVKSYACGVRMDGSIRCWYPGDPNADRTDALGSDVPSGTFSQVCIDGDRAACGLASDGVVSCWGTYGLYDFAPPEGAFFTQISCGEAHACGITTDNDLVCWGYNEYGETDTPT